MEVHESSEKLIVGKTLVEIGYGLDNISKTDVRKLNEEERGRTITIIPQ
jgi:hypothetical protein